MKTILTLIITFTALITIAQADPHQLYSVQKEHGGNFIYLKGGRYPIPLPHAVYIDKPYYSSDLNTVIFKLNVQRSGSGSDYYGLLVATKERKEEDWTIYYTLHSSELNLTYGKRAGVEGIGNIDSYPEVTLHIAYNEYRLPPTNVIREFRDWNIWDSQPLEPVRIDPSKQDLGTTNPWKGMTIEKFKKRMGETNYSNEEITSMIERYGK